MRIHISFLYLNEIWKRAVENVMRGMIRTKIVTLYYLQVNEHIDDVSKHHFWTLHSK